MNEKFRLNTTTHTPPRTYIYTYICSIKCIKCIKCIILVLFTTLYNQYWIHICICYSIETLRSVWMEMKMHCEYNSIQYNKTNRCSIGVIAIPSTIWYHMLMQRATHSTQSHSKYCYAWCMYCALNRIRWYIGISPPPPPNLSKWDVLVRGRSYVSTMGVWKTKNQKPIEFSYIFNVHWMYLPLYLPWQISLE